MTLKTKVSNKNGRVRKGILYCIYQGLIRNVSIYSWKLAEMLTAVIMTNKVPSNLSSLCTPLVFLFFAMNRFYVKSVTFAPTGVPPLDFSSL